MTTTEYLDFVLSIYRAEHRGVTDAAIYELMKAELGPTSSVTMLLAQRLSVDIAITKEEAITKLGAGDFLKSFEWRRVRMDVLEKRGARCECCGRGAKDGASINVDHIKPRGRYPELALDQNNLQVLCGDCNHGKGNKYQTDWRTA